MKNEVYFLAPMDGLQRLRTAVVIVRSRHVANFVLGSNAQLRAVTVAWILWLDILYQAVSLLYTHSDIFRWLVAKRRNLIYIYIWIYILYIYIICCSIIYSIHESGSKWIHASGSKLYRSIVYVSIIMFFLLSHFLYIQIWHNKIYTDMYRSAYMPCCCV